MVILPRTNHPTLDPAPRTGVILPLPLQLLRTKISFAALILHIAYFYYWNGGSINSLHLSQKNAYRAQILLSSDRETAVSNESTLS